MPMASSDAYGVVSTSCGACALWHPRTAPALLARRVCEPIDLDHLATKPEGTLSRAVAAHCRARGLDPSLGYVPPEDEVDWMLHHLLLTHDIWHVVTGWGNDESGEYGVGGFYMAQLSAPPFFGYPLGLAALSTALRRRSFRDFMEAIVTGFLMGKARRPAPRRPVLDALGRALGRRARPVRTRRGKSGRGRHPCGGLTGIGSRDGLRPRGVSRPCGSETLPS